LDEAGSRLATNQGEFQNPIFGAAGGTYLSGMGGLIKSLGHLIPKDSADMLLAVSPPLGGGGLRRPLSYPQLTEMIVENNIPQKQYLMNEMAPPLQRIRELPHIDAVTENQLRNLQGPLDKAVDLFDDSAKANAVLSQQAKIANDFGKYKSGVEDQVSKANPRLLDALKKASTRAKSNASKAKDIKVDVDFDRSEIARLEAQKDLAVTTLKNLRDNISHLEKYGRLGKSPEQVNALQYRLQMFRKQEPLMVKEVKGIQSLIDNQHGITPDDLKQHP
jgi:hypothetical protein